MVVLLFIFYFFCDVVDECEVSCDDCFVGFFGDCVKVIYEVG